MKEKMVCLTVGLVMLARGCSSPLSGIGLSYSFQSFFRDMERWAVKCVAYLLEEGSLQRAHWARMRRAISNHLQRIGPPSHGTNETRERRLERVSYEIERAGSVFSAKHLASCKTSSVVLHSLDAAWLTPLTTPHCMLTIP
ncbi:hypothetical protein TRVA0_044S00694 [Trichomonascus vanleenenianus]|uniref:uncharacterized protein n=1 Tax=Trichomonascus vanleenenianus TaxID=2268995 RepID=UPI003ECA0CC4